MKNKYLIVTKERLYIAGYETRVHYFETLEDAENFTDGLNFPVYIYKAVEKVSIKHIKEKIDD